MTSYVNCAECQEIFDEDYGEECGIGCEDIFCRSCINSGKASVFWFGDHIRCTNCFPTDLPPVTTGMLFYFLLRKYQLSEGQVRTEYRETNPQYYMVPRNIYTCTECAVATCPSENCQLISRDYTDPSTGLIVRGYCCRARKEEELCKGCERWKRQQICITILGIRKFRGRTLLDSLPRDVLIYALLIPWIMKF